MQVRRQGLFGTGVLSMALLVTAVAWGADFYVATNGHDINPGTREKPFATLARAQQAVREPDKTSAGRVSVLVREGTYYLEEPLTFGPGDSGTVERPVTYAAYENEVVTLSGGRRLDCKWTQYKGRIMKCELPDVKQGRLHFGQLFVNGRRQHRARFPNYDKRWRGEYARGVHQPGTAPGRGRSHPRQTADCSCALVRMARYGSVR